MTLETKYNIKDFNIAFIFTVMPAVISLPIIFSFIAVIVTFEAIMNEGFHMTTIVSATFVVIYSMIATTLIHAYIKGSKTAGRVKESNVHIIFRDYDVELHEYTDGELSNEKSFLYSEIKEVLLIKTHLIMKVNSFISIRLKNIEFEKISELKTLLCHKMPIKRIKRIKMNMDRYRKLNKLS